MCPKCFDSLQFNDIRPNRIICGVNIYCVGVYDKNLQKLIRGLKYHNQRDLAFFLAKFMYEYWKRVEDERVFQVIPVPLHSNRVKKRKYNHMTLVTEEFTKLSGYKPNYDLIKRIKDTKPQYKLTRKERLENLANAFEVYPENSLNMPVLILDDICTTGATFEEMIMSLKKSGINEIVCLASSSPIC